MQIYAYFALCIPEMYAYPSFFTPWLNAQITVFQVILIEYVTFLSSLIVVELPPNVFLIVWGRVLPDHEIGVHVTVQDNAFLL